MNHAENPYLKTHQKGAIVATFNTKAYRGQRGATITVTFSRPFPATAQLQVKGHIREDVVFEPEEVHLGVIDQGTLAERSVRVTFTSSNGWQIRQVRSMNPHLSAEVKRAGFGANSVAYDMLVRLDKDAPSGYLHDHLMLVTNDQNSTQFPLLVEGRVRSAVTVSPPSLFLGVLQPGATVTKQVVVQGKRPLRVQSITTDGPAVAVQSTHGGAEAKPLQVIPVTFVAKNTPGEATQTVRIKTDLGDQTFDVPAHAVIATPPVARTQTPAVR